MQTISINFIVPQGWHELGDKQLRYVYDLIAKEYATDEIKTLWGQAEFSVHLLKPGD